MEHAWIFIIILPLLLAQGYWIFTDAEKRGLNKWFWGIFGLLNTPSNLIVYLLVTRQFLASKSCKSCGYYNQKDATYCQNCGTVIEDRED